MLPGQKGPEAGWLKDSEAYIYINKKVAAKTFTHLFTNSFNQIFTKHLLCARHFHRCCGGIYIPEEASSCSHGLTF